MIPIQEIDIYSSNTIKISAHIVVPNLGNPASGAEAVIYDPAFNKMYSAYQIIGQHPDPGSAFKAIIEFSKKYIERSGGSIVRINNPCNTEFVNPEAQQSMLDELSINLTIEVSK